MGKLYLASLRHPNVDGHEFLEVMLVHADITDDLSEHEKTLLIRDWVEDWHKANHPEIKLSGISVKTTLDFVAMDRSEKAKRSLEIRQAPYKNPGPGIYKLRTEYNESASDGPYSVYIATEEDPDNALLAGYGFAYFEALENFMKNMEDTRFDFDENLNVIDPVIYQSNK